MSVAVIGQGFVGGSLTTVLSERGECVYVFDKTGKVATGGSKRVFTDSLPKTITDFVTQCEKLKTFSGVFFICVPTPMYDDGRCDTSIVESVLSEINDAPTSQKSVNRIAVIKSTVPPGSTESWNKKFNSTGLFVIFNPEFLTEANAINDMRDQNRIILGGPRPYINVIKQIYQKSFSKISIVKTSSTTAEMVKYMTNCHLAVKVAYANEIAQICEMLDETGLNIDYDKVVEYAKYDSRLGESHWAVPGPDGKRGYGGHCFPKDLNALIHVAKKLSIDTPVMNGAWKKNLEIRPERDWELQVGRAVTKKESS